jgi:branched-subunit amino acid transport protein
MTEGAGWTVFFTVIGMAVVSVFTRSLFFISGRPWTLPRIVQMGLKYAPVAALTAVIGPEVMMTNGHLIDSWRDARLYSLVAAVGWFHFRKGVLGTILAGMAVYLPLHVGIGW